MLARARRFREAQAALEKWTDAAARAEDSGAWPLAAESQERLSEDLRRLGFLRLSLRWTEKALDSVEHLLENARAPERREHLGRRRLRLGERIAEIELDLRHATQRPVPAH